jgi:hypothetical protein
MQLPPWTLRDRWRARLFPTSYAPVPEPVGDGEGDVLTVTAKTRWSMADRLRLLVTGCSVVQVRIAVGMPVPEHHTTTAAWVEPSAKEADRG